MNSLKTKNYKLGTVLVLSLLILTALFLLRWVDPHLSKESNLKTVLIREGLTVNQISELLNKAGVLEGESLSADLEGYLFPDTYEFFVPSSAELAAKRMKENFNNKVLPFVSADKSDGKNDNLSDIIKVASMIEREVPNSEDRRIVSGIIWKRLRNGYPLQIDATICYVKPDPCYPLSRDDLSKDSPYNTYTRKGLPPTPVSNPGLDAIDAAVNPKNSVYWFYLSDPETGKTIFSVDLDEHNSNIVKYLK